ncbi:stage III sporulation protein AG [Paenibacillus sp. N1-5-1-14]|uniref:stage III sporulation protein AG n=1 Tax=Paenibacillus radicibacter TaxID=2972488 RepID=UPI0021596065|nr:stage III sporulation protein AG [Paenibacillus radicibacter]MCR8642418.1 stage III sporulation protein AG [Paenibacillus radicibacter]
MAKWMNKLEKMFGGGPSGPKRFRTFLWLILAGLLGAALMIMNSFLSVTPVPPASIGPRASPASDHTTTMASGGKELSKFGEYEEISGRKLKEILQKIVGVGDVDVQVEIESTEEIVVDKNYQDSQDNTVERDTGGATRNISSVTRKGEVVIYQVEGNQNPLVIKTIKPKARGVIVVARGAEDLTVKRMILEAVERGLDVPAHRISVLPRKQ